MKYYQDKERYLLILNEALKPLVEFDKASYLREPITGAEIVRVQDSVGTSHFLDVTACDLEGLLLDVFAVAIGQGTERVIKDVARRRRCAALFSEAK